MFKYNLVYANNRARRVRIYPYYIQLLNYPAMESYPSLMILSGDSYEPISPVRMFMADGARQLIARNQQKNSTHWN